MVASISGPRSEFTVTDSGHTNGERILCIRLSGLGDVVHCLNALSVLRRHRPDAEIAWAVEDGLADLLTGHPHVNELIVIPRTRWGPLLRSPWGGAAALQEAGRIARRLRARHFDVSLDFQSSLKSTWVVAAAAARLRVGYARPVSRELNHLVQNRLVSVPKEGIHRIERHLALLGPLGISAGFAPAEVAQAEELPEAVEGVLQEVARPLIVIHPGTSEFASFKRWPEERYVELTNRLVLGCGAGVVVTWGPGQGESAERIVAQASGRAALCPELGGLRQLATVLARAQLFIGGDTGPMHLASALGVPVVALFGPKDPVQTGPYCSRSAVVTAEVECRPCTRRRCADARCMSDITVDSVFEAVCHVLDGGGDSRAQKARDGRSPSVPRTE